MRNGFNKLTKRGKVLTIVAASLVGISAVGAMSGNGTSQPPSNSDTVQPASSIQTTEKSAIKKVDPTCDGKTVIADCTLGNISYKSYVYHPAVSQKSHTETVTTYKEEVRGYCTLCSDGTYSPTCATGRGACSHHGGVAQWNAPISSSVPTNTTKTVIDAPAKDAYYEKSIK
jgi:hypothetical protein